MKKLTPFELLLCIALLGIAIASTYTIQKLRLQQSAYMKTTIETNE